MNILIYCALALLLLGMELAYFRIADKFNIIDKPSQRSSHTKVVLRGGGIIFPLAAWVWAAADAFGWLGNGAEGGYWLFLAGLTLIAWISFSDDVHSQPESLRLIAQVVAVTLMLRQLGLLQLQYWWLDILLCILCVGIMNAYNFMDGINGITGGYSLAVLLPLLFMDRSISAEHTLRGAGAAGVFIEPSLLIVTILAVLVFCFFNFRKKARCFAGDVGAVSIAFIIIFALGKLILWTGDFTYIVFMAVYGVDSVLTIFHRLLLHEKLGQAHRKHAYQLMANELHLPHPLVSLVYMLLQMLISLGMVFIPATALWHWLYFSGVVIVLALAYLLFMKKYYHLHEEYLASLK